MGIGTARRPGRPAGARCAPGPCCDGFHPTCGIYGDDAVCPDGSTLSTDIRRPCGRGRPVCADRSISPLCRDGRELEKPCAPGPCCDGFHPTCGIYGDDAVCPDGSTLSTDIRRPCGRGRPVCADSSISPLCRDGSE